MKTEREHISPVEAGLIAAKLLELGLHPSVIRRRLAEKGIRWRYQFSGTGLRERLRRYRQQGLGLCSECHTGTYPLGNPVNVCAECLEKKWTSAANPSLPAHS